MSDVETTPPGVGGTSAVEPAQATPVTPAPGFLDIIYGIIFQPTATLRELTRHKVMIGRSLAIMALAYLIRGTCAGLYVAGIADLAHRGSFAVVVGIVSIVMGIAFHFVRVAILHLIAAFFGGRGAGPMLFSLTGLCETPALLFGIVALIPQSWVVSLVTTALGIWIAVLTIAAIRESEGLSTGRAVAVFFTPLVVTVALGVICIILMVSFIFGQIPELRSLIPG